jgi:tRNA pseudouridine13 synthase
MRRLYLSAFQSHLWNQMLGTYLYRQFSAGQLGLLPGRLGALPFPRDLDDRQREKLAAASLPLPSSRADFQYEDQRQIADDVLAQAGLSLEQLKVKHPRDCFYSRGARKVLVSAAISVGSPEPDDVYPGRRKLLLEFELPRGAYATIVIKRLMGDVQAEAPRSGVEEEHS